MSRGPKVDFDRPPIDEVVCGVSFHRIEGFSTVHFGVLWTLFAEEFPGVEDQRPLIKPGPGPHELFPQDRRVWFVSADERYLVQVQRDRFLFNWRRLDKEDVYPRFEAVFTAFARHLGAFKEFVGELETEQFELTYINVIPMRSASYSDVGSILRDLPWRADSILHAPEGFQWVVEGLAPFGGDSRLTVVAQGARRKEDDAPVIRLELTVRGPATVDLATWFESAHDSIVQSFVDLTTDDAHSTWGRRT